jgi:hypothetical protein
MTLIARSFPSGESPTGNLIRIWVREAKKQRLTLRQEAGKGESFSNMKPFNEILRVTIPVRQSRASSREASLTWGEVTLTAKRGEIKRCVIEPRNFLVVSPRLCQSRGPSPALASPGPAGVPGHTGVGEHGECSNGFNGNLGYLAVSIRKCRLENRAKKSRLIRSQVLGWWRSRFDEVRAVNEFPLEPAEGSHSLDSSAENPPVRAQLQTRRRRLPNLEPRRPVWSNGW